MVFFSFGCLFNILHIMRAYFLSKNSILATSGKA
jgi:hypothetical protein